MITFLLHLLRLFPFLFGGHRQLAVENLALRQQLAVYKRTTARPKLRTTDRLCLPLIGPIGSRRLPQVFVMKPTDAWHCHHPALARWLHTPRLRRVLRQR